MGRIQDHPDPSLVLEHSTVGSNRDGQSDFCEAIRCDSRAFSQPRALTCVVPDPKSPGWPEVDGITTSRGGQARPRGGHNNTPCQALFT